MAKKYGILYFDNQDNRWPACGTGRAGSIAGKATGKGFVRKIYAKLYLTYGGEALLFYNEDRFI